MIATASPIHTATVNGVAVRFFRGPAEGPDMPWHAHDDLLAALTLPRSLRRALRAALLREWRNACHTVEVDGEPTLLAPHFVAQGMIGMAKDVAGAVTTAPEIVDRDYHRAGVPAMKALTAHLPDAKDRAAWAIEAFRAQGGTA